MKSINVVYRIVSVILRTDRESLLSLSFFVYLYVIFYQSKLTQRRLEETPFSMKNIIISLSLSLSVSC